MQQPYMLTAIYELAQQEPDLASGVATPGPARACALVL